MSEWKKVRLGDISIDGGHYGIGAAAVEYDESLPTYLRITDIREDGTIIRESLKSVDDPDACEYYLKPNDLVIARTGASTGRNYFYDGRDGQLVYAGFLIRFSIDERKIWPPYVKYWFQGSEYRTWLLNHTDGSTRANINAVTLGDCPIYCPTDVSTQRKIAAVLSSLDDKIENNRKICANLEAQAQAIFKSWFVDFEPFGGKMPQGWKMGKLGDVCKIFDSRRIPLSSLQRAEMQGDIPYYGATSIVDYVNDFLLEGIYLLMGEDGSVITDKGYPFLQYIWGKFWPNNHAHVLQGTNGYTTEMLYCLLSQTKVERYVTGAVQPKISQGNMIMIPACIPEGSDAKKFSGMIQPLFDELRCITDESRALAEMRDALLPKLMSGEIDVEKVKVA